jgi:beta-adrenergic-receptor kinase
MDQIEEIPQDFVQFKNEQCIQIRFRDGLRDNRVILTNPVRLLKINLVFQL